jgi:hypothetical protein
VSSESVPDRFRKTIADYKVQADFGVGFGFPGRLDSGADGQQMDGASTKISSTSVVAMSRSFTQSDSIDCCKVIVLSSLIYLLLMRRQTWALKSRLRAAEG